MASLIALTVAVLAFSWSADAQAPGTGMRHLTQAAGSVSSCYWLEKQQVCLPSTLNMLAVPASTTPSNVFRRAYLMALDRSEACSKKYTSEAACMTDTKNRCFWSKVDSRGICLSADYAEITAFERSGFLVDLATLPSSMTCPGSKAREFFSCYAHPAPELCSKLPGCAVAPAAMTQGRPVCLPKSAAGLDKKAAEALAGQLKALDPALFGTCEAACWLKQARTCSSASSSQATCQKNSFCVFNERAKAAGVAPCMHAQVAKPGKDAFDDKLEAAMSACGKLASKAACTARTVKLEQAGKWAAWAMPAAAAKC